MYNINPETPMLVSSRDVDDNGSVDPLILLPKKTIKENGSNIQHNSGIT